MEQNKNNSYQRGTETIMICVVLFVVFLLPFVVALLLDIMIFLVVLPCWRRIPIQKKPWAWAGVITLGLFLCFWIRKNIGGIEELKALVLLYAEELVWDISHLAGFGDRWSYTLTRFTQLWLLVIPAIALFFPYAFRKRLEDLRGRGGVSRFVQLRKTNPKKMSVLRSQTDDLFLGVDQGTNRPVYLTKEELNLHTQVIGATGFGKTASVLVPMLEHHIRQGRGLVLVDGKAGTQLYYQLRALLKKYGRMNDLRFFSLNYPADSKTYNPLRHGLAIEIKDRLVGSQVWSEEYYKKVAERVLMILATALIDCKKFPTLSLVLEGLENPRRLGLNNFRSASIKQDFEEYCENHKAEKKDYAGIVADLKNLVKGDYASLFDEKPDGIDLMDAYCTNKVVFFQIPTARVEDTAKRLGRIILYDVKAMCSQIESDFLPHQRKFFPVMIDEFASFAFPSFIDFINKARSSGAGITILHQSLGDIKTTNLGDGYSQQIAENTNCKIMMRVDDPGTVDYFSSMIGTVLKKYYTHQTEWKLFFRTKTGGASERVVDQFIVHPNEFRNLKVGEAIVYVKTRSKVYHVKLDYPFVDYRSMAQAYPVRDVSHAQQEQPAFLPQKDFRSGSMDLIEEGQP